MDSLASAEASCALELLANALDQDLSLAGGIKFCDQTMVSMTSDHYQTSCTKPIRMVAFKLARNSWMQSNDESGNHINTLCTKDAPDLNDLNQMWNYSIVSLCAAMKLNIYIYALLVQGAPGLFHIILGPHMLVH